MLQRKGQKPEFEMLHESKTYTVEGKVENKMLNYSLKTSKTI